MRLTIRRNILLLLSVAVYFGALTGVVYVMENWLKLEKRDYLLREQSALLRLDKDRYGWLVKRVFMPTDTTKDAEEKQRLKDEALAMLATTMREDVVSTGPIYLLRLEDVEGNVLIEESQRSKIWRNRQWGNTIFFNFSTGFTGPITDDDVTLGRLYGRYTNLPDDPVVASITRKHRPRIIGAVAGLTLAFAIILYFVIFPIQNVTAALPPTTRAAPRLLSRPRTGMENSYNRMAADALLRRADEDIRSIPDEDESFERFEAQQRICRALGGLFAYGPLWIVARAPDADHFVLRAGHPTDGEFDAISSLDHAALGIALDEWVNSADEPIEVALRLPDGSNVAALAAPLPAVEPDTFENALIAVVKRRGGDISPTPRARELFMRVARQTARSIGQRHGRQQQLARERSEANINLARHLGHDLTNIIATSKLDLMAVKSYLGMIESDDDDPRRAIFSESLEALLKNTFFLQEVVNHYRSFSYVRHPRYEETDVNALVSNITELFVHSTSAEVDVVFDLDASNPLVVLEPRLTRLALFNLMTNALEAIRRRSAREGRSKTPDTLRLTTKINTGRGELSIGVRDTGPGIRGHDDELLAEDELRSILFIGKTTKDEEGAEGLGLDWVRTVVEEFHDGRVEPHNIEGGGAEFVLHIPLNLPTTNPPEDEKALD